jgi:predicted lactoylglutathione lyase
VPERASFDGDKGTFSVVAGTPSEHVDMAFSVPDRASVDAFHRAAIAAGGHAAEAVEAPGAPVDGTYAVTVSDPDANAVGAVHRGRR